MLALQGKVRQICPSQLQELLGIHSEQAVHILLTQCPELAKLEPSTVLSRLCKLKVG